MRLALMTRVWQLPTVNSSHTPHYLPSVSNPLSPSPDLQYLSLINCRLISLSDLPTSQAWTFTAFFFYSCFYSKIIVVVAYFMKRLRFIHFEGQFQTVIVAFFACIFLCVIFVYWRVIDCALFGFMKVTVYLIDNCGSFFYFIKVYWWMDDLFCLFDYY